MVYLQLDSSQEQYATQKANRHLTQGVPANGELFKCLSANLNPTRDQANTKQLSNVWMACTIRYARNAPTHPDLGESTPFMCPPKDHAHATFPECRSNRGVQEIYRHSSPFELFELPSLFSS
jgi:hypothetical protein